MDTFNKISQIVAKCVVINMLELILSEAASIASTCREDIECGLESFCIQTINMCMTCIDACDNLYSDSAFCEIYCPQQYKELMSSTTTQASLLTSIIITGPTPAQLINEASISTAILIVGLLLTVATILVVGAFLFNRRHRFIGNESTTSSTISLEQPIYKRQISSTTTGTPLLQHPSVDAPSQPGFPTQATDTYGPEKDVLVPGKGTDPGPGMKLYNPEDPLKNRSAENDR